MRCTAGSRAAATSARRARPRTAKRCATTSIIRTWRRGSSPVSAESRSCTRSRWCSRKCILRRGVTSDAESRIPNPESRRGSRVRLKLKIWRQAGPGTAGRLVDYAADHVSPDMSFLEMLDVVKDLVVDRSALDRIITAGGYVSVNCGGAPDGNAIPIAKEVSETAMDSAACIGCGACVAACKNASAHLFMSAKISHLSLLPQG